MAAPFLGYLQSPPPAAHCQLHRRSETRSTHAGFPADPVIATADSSSTAAGSKELPPPCTQRATSSFHSELPPRFDKVADHRDLVIAEALEDRGMRQGATALVTGAGGFIGHHLVKYLIGHGYTGRGADIKHPEYEGTSSDEVNLADHRGWN